ncbi:obsolete negative regulation of cAMP metabolic process [Mactra antiquata]
MENLQGQRFFSLLNTTEDRLSYKRHWKNLTYGSQCGQCQGNCIYSAIEIGFLIGVIANLVVIGIILKDSRLRHPAFMGIAALAFADLIFLCVNLVLSFETVITTLWCIRPVVLSRPFYIIKSVTWFSANAHVALLAIIRYVSIAHPLRACSILLPLRVFFISCGVWILGLILLGSLSLLITHKIITPGISKEFVIVWWLMVYLLPLTVTVILHILKLCFVRTVLKQKRSPDTENRKLVQRMSTIVVMVIIMATVLPLPRLAYHCLRVSGILTSVESKMHLKGISQLFYLLNHCVNPFIYGFLSITFRRSLKSICLCADDDDTEHSITKESSIFPPNQSVTMETKQ